MPKRLLLAAILFPLPVCAAEAVFDVSLDNVPTWAWKVAALLGSAVAYGLWRKGESAHAKRHDALDKDLAQIKEAATQCREGCHVRLAVLEQERPR